MIHLLTYFLDYEFNEDTVMTQRPKMKSMYQNDLFMNSNKSLLVFINIFP